MNILPYSPGSSSAKNLANSCNVKLIRKEGKPLTKPFINWGNSVISRMFKRKVFNKPESVAIAVNKLQAFKTLDGHVGIPKFTEARIEASRWLAEGVCKRVVCRTKLNGHSGDGIIIAKTPEELVDAPLYVEYIPKKQEYRIHATPEKVFHIQHKKKRKGVENNPEIRNHKNGWVYTTENVGVDPVAKLYAIDAVKCLGLDFGAVDVIYNEKQNKFYVLEINTAPGLTGRTLEKYVQMFKELI